MCHRLWFFLDWLCRCRGDGQRKRFCKSREGWKSNLCRFVLRFPWEIYPDWVWLGEVRDRGWCEIPDRDGRKNHRRRTCGRPEPGREQGVDVLSCFREGISVSERSRNRFLFPNGWVWEVLHAWNAFFLRSFIDLWNGSQKLVVIFLVQDELFSWIRLDRSK